MSIEFTHPVLNEEVRSITGGYTLIKEVVKDVGGQRLLYFVGGAQFDSSCCGTGGCGYALVSGFVVKLKSSTDADGQPVSVVDPIDGAELRRGIIALIKREEMVQDIQFWSTKEEGP